MSTAVTTTTYPFRVYAASFPGISITDILEVYQYITSGTSSTAPEMTLEQHVEAPLYLLRAYEQQLANWYLLGGFDVNYGTWGW